MTFTMWRSFYTYTAQDVPINDKGVITAEERMHQQVSNDEVSVHLIVTTHSLILAML